MADSKSHLTAANNALKRTRGKMICNTAYHQENQMASELNNCFERIRDEVLTGVHSLVEGQDEVPPV